MKRLAVLMLALAITAAVWLYFGSTRSTPPSRALTNPEEESQDEAGSATLSVSEPEERESELPVEGAPDAEPHEASAADEGVEAQPAVYQDEAGRWHYPTDEAEFRDAVWPNREHWIRTHLASFKENRDNLSAAFEVIGRSMMVIMDDLGRHDDLESRYAALTQYERQALPRLSAERLYPYEVGDFPVLDEWNALLASTESGESFNFAAWSYDPNAPKMNDSFEASILMLADDALNLIESWNQQRK